MANQNWRFPSDIKEVVIFQTTIFVIQCKNTYLSKYVVNRARVWYKYFQLHYENISRNHKQWGPQISDHKNQSSDIYYYK